MSLKSDIKSYAYSLGADLVGFGNVERCEHAPLMMSPQGLYPACRTVIVLGIHHPDACVELGGEEHPQEIGPYSVQYLINTRLDDTAYRLATFMEDRGCGAMPVACSNIWRYNQYKDLKAVFAPDVSHIYMSVVAGLSEVGYSGLAITPEYGARNRFITILTDVELEPDPLIPPGTVCDNCMLCRKHCPTAALSKEIDGDKVLKIENYEYRFPDKNLWRCAWGEHFDLDVDLDIPEQVTEDVIVDTIAKHGRRSGEMGQCLKFCLPANRRASDKAYSRSPVRRLPAQYDETREERGTVDRVLADAESRGLDTVIVSTAEELRKHGIDIGSELKGAASAITCISSAPKLEGPPPLAHTNRASHHALKLSVDFACFDIAKRLEACGFRSLVSTRPYAPCTAVNEHVLARHATSHNRNIFANSVLTTKRIPPQERGATAAASPGDVRRKDARKLASRLEHAARDFGADRVGFAPVERLNHLAGQLVPLFSGEETLAARDRSEPFTKWDPEVTSETRSILRAGDYLEGAKSVIVFALRQHEAPLQHAVKTPAEAVGPYVFQTYATDWVGGQVAFRLLKHLEQWGWKGAIAADLLNTAGFIATPRGPELDTSANRFAAIAAGRGGLLHHGRDATRECAIRQRFVAVVTDAEIAPSSVCPQEEVDALCAACDRKCVNSCPSRAFSEELFSVECEGVQHRFARLDRARCDWSKRYALTAESGFAYLGSDVDDAPPESMSPDELAGSLHKLDPVKKHRPVVAEPCVLNCPHV